MTNYDPDSGYKSGYIAIIGKPNAGKSTLMNAILGTKLSIATHKIQTTRHRITGVYSHKEGQIVFLDTPGIIQPKYGLHEKMMRAVERAAKDADIVLFLIDPNDLPDEETLSWISKNINKKVIIAINKADANQESQLKSANDTISAQLDSTDILTISAIQNIGVHELIESLLKYLPEGPPFYPPDQLSDQPERFFTAELIREQIFLQYQAEIPYSTAVNIISFNREADMDHIEAEIVVNRNSQKGIIIGKGGKALKKLSTAARENIEEFTGRKCFLRIHVKVREKWRDKDIFLRDFGYN